MLKNVITCKLTGDVGPGIDAHIIPRCFYEYGHDGQQPRFLACSDANTVIQKRSPIGEYDSEIVTKEGEEYFRDCDSYAFQTLVRWRDHNPALIHDGHSPQYIELGDFDYPKLKMFFITLLWRAGVSEREFSRNVSLGPHETRLKDLILRKDPGLAEDYSVMIGIHKDTPKPGFPVFAPRLLRDKETQIRYYCFELGHFVASIKVDNRPWGQGFEGLVISDSSPLRLFILDEFRKTSLSKGCLNVIKRLRNR